MLEKTDLRTMQPRPEDDNIGQHVSSSIRAITISQISHVKFVMDIGAQLMVINDIEHFVMYCQ